MILSTSKSMGALRSVQPPAVFPLHVVEDDTPTY
jgi:hypothetical protein